jgi:type I restriction enzyme S subunit
LTIAKKFIPSVANIVGTDMENYKIIRKNQFACSLMQVRRDKKIPVALLQEYDEAIISQAYPIFEVNSEKELLPEYLMMWFSRTEFDREACFYAVGGVRGSLEWDDFCDMKLPVPDIAKQQEIVDEYTTIKKRMSLNTSLISKLEETAQAVYREWFVDGIDPENLPSGWKISNLSKIANYLNGLAMQNFEPKTNEDFLPVIKIRELNL